MTLRSAPLNDLPDRELIGLAQRGDEKACSALVERHLVPLRAFVALRLPVNHLVDEITHETFVFAFAHLAGFEPDGSFRGWLRTIAHNMVRRELLRFAREKQNLSKFEQLQIADLAERHEQDPGDEVIFLEECLGLLPENMRRLLDDRYKHGHSGAEIAKGWGRTEEWVRVTLLRVRRQLRACIDGKITGAPHAS